MSLWVARSLDILHNIINILRVHMRIVCTYVACTLLMCNGPTAECAFSLHKIFSKIHIVIMGGREYLPHL